MMRRHIPELRIYTPYSWTLETSDPNISLHIMLKTGQNCSARLQKQTPSITGASIHTHIARASVAKHIEVDNTMYSFGTQKLYPSVVETQYRIAHTACNYIGIRTPSSTRSSQSFGTCNSIVHTPIPNILKRQCHTVSPSFQKCVKSLCMLHTPNLNIL